MERAYEVVREAVASRVAREAAVAAERGQPTVGRDPERAVAALEQRPEVIARQAIPDGQDDEPASFETSKPAPVGADPYPARAVLENGADVIGGQAVADAVARPAPAGEAIEPVVRPHPEPAGAVLAQRQHRRAVEDGAAGHRSKPPLHEEGDLTRAGAYPQPPSRRGGDGVDVLVGEPLRGPIAEDRAVLDLAQPDAPHPQAALAVLEGDPDRIGRQPVPAGEDVHTTVVQAVEAPVGADPEAAPAVAQEPPNVVVIQDEGRAREAASLELVEPVAGGPDPQSPLAVDRERAHRNPAFSRGKRVAFEAAGARASEAGWSPDPDAAVAVREEAEDGVADEAVLLHVSSENVFVKAVQPVAVRADPQVALGVLGQGADGPRRQSLPRRVGPEAAVPVAQQGAAIDADPQRPVAGDVDRLHVVGAHGGRAPPVEHGEAHAVEPRQALLGRQPDVAVGRLGDGLHEVVGKTVVGLPRGDAVLADGLGGVESRGGAGAQQQGETQRREAGGAATFDGQEGLTQEIQGGTGAAGLQMATGRSPFDFRD
jgi:hypothetical protein